MNENIWLRRFSKMTALSTLFLIFAGGMVTSTGSGLAVPDWPLSYGTLFPPMIGGVFYEHGHRMIATVVGFLTLCLAVWLWFKEERQWVKVLGLCCLGAVIVQGLLGGITVLFYLPTPVSVAHGVLAQTFFLMTIFVAYSQSSERRLREAAVVGYDRGLQNWALLFVGTIYLQLIFGAVMRHTGSGLAIYDFPTMAGQWWPILNSDFLANVNAWRFEQGLDPVSLTNVAFHLIHRLWAGMVLIVLAVLNWVCFKCEFSNRLQILQLLFVINIFILVQVCLGIATVLSLKGPIVTSLHVVTGAGLLGLSFLLFLRIAPVNYHHFRGVA